MRARVRRRCHLSHCLASVASGTRSTVGQTMRRVAPLGKDEVKAMRSSVAEEHPRIDPGILDHMWDKRFSEPGYAYGTEPNEFLTTVADRIPMGRVLSLAEGEGRNAVFLAGLGYEVTAVDTSTVGLAKAERLAAERGVSITTVHADLAEFEIEPAPGRASSRSSATCRRSFAQRSTSAVCGDWSRVARSCSRDSHPRQLELATGGPKTPRAVDGIGDSSPGAPGAPIRDRPRDRSTRVPRGSTTGGRLRWCRSSPPRLGP